MISKGTLTDINGLELGLQEQRKDQDGVVIKDEAFGVGCQTEAGARYGMIDIQTQTDAASEKATKRKGSDLNAIGLNIEKQSGSIVSKMSSLIGS